LFVIHKTYVDILAGLLSEEVLEHLLNLGDTGGATDENDVVDVRLLQLGVLEDLFDGLEGLLEEVIVQLLELGTSQGLREVLALVEALDFDLGSLLRGEGTLGLLDLALEFTHGLGVLGDIDIVFLVVLLGEVVDDTVVKVLTTEMGVTGSSLDLKDTFPLLATGFFQVMKCLPESIVKMLTSKVPPPRS
jgi:hypothetical protein